MWKRIAAGRDEFAIWAAGAARWKRVLAFGALAAVMAATLFALIVMGPRLVREGGLLLAGIKTEGVVREARVEEAGKFKGGDQKYRLLLTYDFSIVDGRRFEGRTERTDLRQYPALKAGDRISIHYDAADPRRSVADYNLMIDVVALALFLPFLAVFGLVLPILFVARGLNRRGARAM